MTFHDGLVSDVSEYINEYFMFKNQVVEEGFTALTMVDKNTNDITLVLYYGIGGYTIATVDALTLFQSSSYRKFVKYINSLKWEVCVYAG